jgi:hypothetical protein
MFITCLILSLRTYQVKFALQGTPDIPTGQEHEEILLYKLNNLFFKNLSLQVAHFSIISAELLIKNLCLLY